MPELSRRKKLLELAETGNLRYALERAHVEDDVTSLIVDLCIRYCEPKRQRRGALVVNPPRHLKKGHAHA